MCFSLPRRLFLGRRDELEDGGPPAYYPKQLPATLSAMPALAELELVGPSFLSAAPEQELAAAQQPAFACLTSLNMSSEGDSSSEATALYLWLRWALPAAPQLRKLSVSGSEWRPYEGSSPSRCCVHEACVCTAAPLTAATVLVHQLLY